MFVKLYITLALWISTFLGAAQPTSTDIEIPLGTNPLSVDESKIVAYLKDNPSLLSKSNFVFVDDDEDYKLAHLLGKLVVDVRYRTKPVVSETDSLEEVQDKINKFKSATSIESDEVVLALLGNMTETVKVSD